MRGKVTISEYYKGFRNLYAFGAGIPFLPPLIHQIFGEWSTTADSLYPPLGDMETLGITLTCVVLLLITFVVFVCCQSARKVGVIVHILLLVVFVAGVGGLTFLYQSFVKVIPIESMNKSIPVSIGYERTKVALSVYPNDGDSKHDDWTMLNESGPWESKIQLLWTAKSIWIVRYSLWTCYTLTLGCFLAAVSLGVYRHVLESPPKTSESAM